MSDYAVMPLADYKAICDATRAQTGRADLLKSGEVADAIAGIAPVLEPITITENGSYAPGEGVDGFDKVTVEVYDEFLKLMSSAPVYSNVTLPDDLEIDLTGFPNLISIMNMLNRSTCKNVVLRLPSEKITSIQQCFYLSSVVEITIYGEFETVVTCAGVFAGCRKLERINFVIPAFWLSHTINYYNPFYNSDALKHVRFSPNGKGGSNVAMYWSAVLEDESIVSIANALIAQTDTSYTISLHATPKARCDEIIGTVSTVTDGDMSYDFFTMDESGTITLTEFITNVKGWTVA